MHLSYEKKIYQCCLLYHGMKAKNKIEKWPAIEIHLTITVLANNTSHVTGKNVVWQHAISQW